MSLIKNWFMVIISNTFERKFEGFFFSRENRKCSRLAEKSTNHGAGRIVRGKKGKYEAEKLYNYIESEDGKDEEEKETIELRRKRRRKSKKEKKYRTV